MGSVLLTGAILVILSTWYANALTLSDLYPYGIEHGDTMSNGTDLPEVSIEPPIDNLVGFSPAGLTGTSYEISHNGKLDILNDGDDIIRLLLLQLAGDFSNTKIYGRSTNDAVLIKRAMNQINEGFPNTFCSTSPPSRLIIATWIDYQKTDTDTGSNFQVIVATNQNITFGIALYVNVHLRTAFTGIGSIINGTSVYQRSFFPIGTDVASIPNMMSNSNIPGTYITSLNHIPPDPCTEPDCSVVCKAKLLRMACEAMGIDGKDLPAPCRN
ncbi:PREDICTED: uncharacterized protein LOC109586465 [Amphimedon queenslandica]|uniref:NIDO domain-containing protein n=1 Tax=Amphimedon queenslandica TaxID=400682 RepID=A0A1X7TQT9_AMPQE|nr:PREDICTED: uncharacterized protein LOC109586465 [Amphimedon queenslandica]|eukprot:XP_019858214.1 PREDICTED: uncharacterized protein LOC109586465 [Amphimedon queenslandica]